MEDLVSIYNNQFAIQEGLRFVIGISVVEFLHFRGKN